MIEVTVNNLNHWVLYDTLTFRRYISCIKRTSFQRFLIILNDLKKWDVDIRNTSLYYFNANYMLLNLLFSYVMSCLECREDVDLALSLVKSNRENIMIHARSIYLKISYKRNIEFFFFCHMIFCCSRSFQNAYKCLFVSKKENKLIHINNKKVICKIYLNMFSQVIRSPEGIFVLHSISAEDKHGHIVLTTEILSCMTRSHHKK